MENVAALWGVGTHAHTETVSKAARDVLPSYEPIQILVVLDGYFEVERSIASGAEQLACGDYLVTIWRGRCFMEGIGNQKHYLLERSLTGSAILHVENQIFSAQA